MASMTTDRFAPEVCARAVWLVLEHEKLRRYADLKAKIRRVFEENFSVYGARKVWRQWRGRAEARRAVQSPA